MTRFMARIVLGLVSLLVFGGSIAHAATDSWIGGTGFWTNLPGNPNPAPPNQTTWWSLLHPPGTSDSASFTIPATYAAIVTGTPPSFEDLSLTAGALTLESDGDGFIPNLNVTSTTAGTQTISVSGASTALNLGTSNALSSLVVNTNTLNVQSGATVKVLTGSQLNTSANSLAGGALINGTVIVDGTGAKFTSGIAVTNTDQTQVGSGGTGALTFQAGSGGTIAGALGIADAASASNGTVTIKGSSTVTLKGSLRLSTQGVSSANATLNIDNASLDQQDFNFVTDVPTGVIVGSNLGTATLNVGTTTSGGSLSTGSLGLTINQNGAVNVGSGTTTGTLSVNGGLTVTGGGIGNGLSVQAGSSLNFASSFLTVQSGGQVVVPSYVTSFSSTTAITGASAAAVPSRISASTGFVSVNNNGAVHLTSGGVLTAFRDIDVANSGSGTMTADGIGSAINADGGTSSFSSFWGLGGNTATVTLSNAATASFSGGIDLAKDTTSGTNANVTVQSGAKLSAGKLTLASVGGATTSANLTITGAGSAVALNPFSTLTVGSSTTGTATINVNSGGSLSLGSGGITTLNPTGTINVNGGSIDLKTIVNNGGHLNVVTGSVASDAFTAGPGGALGTDPTIATGQVVTVAGDTTIDASHTLALDGGHLSTGGLINHGYFAFNLGTLEFTRDGAAIDTPIVTNSPDTLIKISADNVAIGKDDDPNGFKHQGKLDVGNKTLTLKSADQAEMGQETSLAGGTVKAPKGFLFQDGKTLKGSGKLEGPVEVREGAVVTPNGNLDMGDDTSPAGVNFAGKLDAQNFDVTFRSKSQSTLDGLTTMANAKIHAAHGIKSDSGSMITGYGLIDTPNDPSQKDMLDGQALGTSPSQPLEFPGYVTGSGRLNNVKMEGTHSPGASPTLLSVGNLEYTPTSTLIMELGGITRGTQYDAIDSDGNLKLAGTLQVSLINGFAPVVGNSFHLFSWSSLTGAFSPIVLPALSGAKAWNASQLFTTGTLSVISTLTGDYNGNGVVDAADYTVWRDTLGSTTDLRANGDNNGASAGKIDQADYLVWKSNFGMQSGSGANGNTAVPEPTTGILSIIGGTVAGFLIRRHA